MKVAFASTDKIHIDQHFGRAEEFYIWDISSDSAEFSGIIQVKSEGDDEADRIEARCSGLNDCALVYVAEIGGPAAARLVAKRFILSRVKIEHLLQIRWKNYSRFYKELHHHGCAKP